MPDLYSNCVILEFASPITRAQLDVIREQIELTGERSVVKLPPLRQPPVCGERESNCVVPTIAADEC